MLSSPVATFDCLFLAESLTRGIDGFSKAELHLFSYLACLLWMYSEKPQSDWGYSFVGTEFGAPYSKEIDESADCLFNWGYFEEHKDRLRSTSISQDHLRMIEGQSMFLERADCLKASVSSILALPVGTIREALGQEPELRKAKTLPASRVLLEDAAAITIYQDFAILREALGGTNRDLRVPALAWLMALFEDYQKRDIAA
jgi:hypothetical protein